MRIRFNQSNGSALLEEQLMMKKIEKAQARRQIQHFCTFIPDEILQLHGISTKLQIQHFVGVLLCVDITEIIELIESYHKGGLGELYKVCVNLNAYLGSIIEVLRCYGGDVLNIFSNNFVTLWKVLPEQSMYEMLHNVVVCANVIQRILGTYETDVSTPKKIKTAVSCGNVSLGLTGDHEEKQIVIVGDAFESLRSATKAANFGDVIVSLTAWPHMLQERYTVGNTGGNEYIKILKISYKSSEVTKKAYYDEKYVNVVGLIEKHYHHRNEVKNLLASFKQMTKNKLTEAFAKELPERNVIKSAVRQWSIEEMKPLLNEIVFVQITESQPVEYLTEVREVTAMCFKIVPVKCDNPSLIRLINNFVVVIIQTLKPLFATINNVYVTEHGIIINVLFGLMLINHENESLNALKYSFKIKTLLEEMPTLEVSVGVSSGIVYCSVFGHPLRREYAVIGRPVVDAKHFAQLFSDKITCDFKIYDSSKLSSLYFKLVSEAEQLFEYDENCDVTETSVQLKLLIDRKSDYNLIGAMIQNPTVVGFRGICLEGAEMIGKTKLLTHIHEQIVEKDCIKVFISLNNSRKFPYYCASEIYASIFDQIATITSTMMFINDLPRSLLTFHNFEDMEEDIALQKYRTLNYFRDIVNFSNRVIVLFIDNIEFIDLQSWEILELTFPAEHMRLVMAGTLQNSPWDLKKKLDSISEIRIKEVLPLKPRFITPLVCSFLNVQAVSRQLITLLELTCGGVPGFVECCLLRLMNNGIIELMLSRRTQIDTEAFCYLDIEKTKKIETVFPILDFSTQKMDAVSYKLTIERIYLDLFDSFTPFQQLVVKTGSLLGSTFGRTLLVVCLNYPQELLLAESIKILFEERVFECGSLFVTAKRYDPSIVCCRCHFDEVFFNDERRALPKYAFCKLIHFRNQSVQIVAYKRIPENQRRELHILCAEVLEQMEHICPNCIRNPANFYAFFGKYKDFIQFCEDPSQTPDYYAYAKDSYENIKLAISYHMSTTTQMPSRRPGSMYSGVIDEKYIPVKRNYNPASCRCLEMLHVIYQDIIVHSSSGNEFGKMIFFKMKYGLIQLCMRDIAGAIETLQETRELAMSNVHTSKAELGENFRRYHVGTASVALAICNMKTKNIQVAKNNIILALRQYNVPTLAFTFKQFGPFLRRRHLKLPTLHPFNKKHSSFGWELSIAMFICAKIFAMDKNWSYARDCCEYSISLMKTVNNDIPMLMDIFCSAIDIYRKSGDHATCLRLQMYLIHEFQAKYAKNNTFYFHTLVDFLDVLIDVSVAHGNIRKSIRLGYRLMHITENSQILNLKPNMLQLLCELNIYTLSFREFIDIFTILTRHLNPSHESGFVLHYMTAMHCYNYTGFFIVKFENVLKYAKEYFENKITSLSLNDLTLKLLINVQLLRRGRYERAKQWEISYDFSNALLSNSKVVKMLLFQVEGLLLRMCRTLRLSQIVHQDLIRPKIKILFRLLKQAVDLNVIYKSAYLSLWAWYLMLTKRKLKAKSLLKKIYDMAKKCENRYFMALVVRLKNYWDGGFLYEFELRPHVSVHMAPTYTFEQFTQFLHPYILD